MTVAVVCIYKNDLLQEGAVDNAVRICKTSVMKDDVDGAIQGTWLLTE